MGRDGKGNVGFIGIGTMGREMVLNLLKAGHAVCAFDLSEAAVADVTKEGASRAENPADAARGADIVITMLPDTPHVEAVIYGPHGLLQSPPPGGLIVDMSTISPVAVRRIYADLKQATVSFIDAPVSGGPLGRQERRTLDHGRRRGGSFCQGRTVLPRHGHHHHHVGASGAGQTVKLCNQLVCGINIQAICEALALGRASGVDLNLLREYV